MPKLLNGPQGLKLIMIAVLIALAIGCALLGVNAGTSTAERGETARLAERLRAQAESMGRVMLEMSASTTPSRPKVEQLRTARLELDRGITLIKDGGELDGVSYAATATNSELDSARQRLTTLATSIDALVADPSARGITSAARAATDHAGLLAGELAQVADRAAATWRTSGGALWHWIALALGLAAALLAAHTVVALSREQQALQALRNQTSNILETVGEGLFLLDRHLLVNGAHSRSIDTLLGQGPINGRHFIDVLRKLVPEKALDTTRKFLDLLFGERVNPNLMRDLNPLDRVEVEFKEISGSTSKRMLEFQFSRVKDSGSEPLALVTVADITRVVRLEAQLDDARQKARKDLDVLFQALSVEPKLMAAFQLAAHRALHHINQQLENSDSHRGGLKALVDDIFRTIHKVKGEASALKLDYFAIPAHEFEDGLAELKRMPVLSGNDFLPLTVKLKTLFDRLEFLNELASRMSLNRTSTPADVPTPSSPAVATPSFTDSTTAAASASTSTWTPPTGERQAGLKELLLGLVDDVSQRQKKQVRLNLMGDDGLFPETKRDALKDVLTQLVRNAIVHGVEVPDKRKALGKPQVGTVTISINRAPGNLIEIICRDDGSGIDFDRVRQVAIEKGFMGADQARAANEGQLLGLLFQNGFSTATQTDMDAGRGVGMDLIRQTLSGIGGQLKVASTAGRYAQFRVVVPV